MTIKKAMRLAINACKREWGSEFNFWAGETYQYKDKSVYVAIHCDDMFWTNTIVNANKQVEISAI